MTTNLTVGGTDDLGQNLSRSAKPVAPEVNNPEHLSRALI